MALSGTVIMGGLFTVVRTSTINANQARVEAVLNSAADRVSGWAYNPCPAASGTGSYADVAQAAAGSVGWPASTVSILSVEYFDPAVTGPDPWSSSNSVTGVGCNPGVNSTSPRTVQKITLRVTTPAGDYSRQLEVVKNNVIPDSLAG